MVLKPLCFSDINCGWVVIFGAARRGLGGTAAHPGPSSLYQM